MTRTDKALRNAKFALLCQLATLISAFVTRKFIADYLFPEYLGLSGLFSNILTVLSLAELGFGTSITYSLYRPLLEKNEEKTAALMRLFQKTYIIIGIVVLVLGLSLTPALGFFVEDIESVKKAIPDLSIIYVLYVVNTSASYFFSYKRTLLVADQKQYLTSVVTSAVTVLNGIATCICIACWKNYILVMLFSIVFTVADNVFVTIVANRTYGFLKEKKNAVLDEQDKKEIGINVRSTILHNIGGVAVNGTDNILISKFVSLVTEGFYANYHLISAAVDSILRLLIQSLTPSYGNLTAGTDENKKVEIYNNMFFASSWLYGFAAVCLFILLRPFVDLWLGTGFELESSTVFILVVNFYVTGMRRVTLLAKDAMGLMRYDRFKPIAEAVINLVVSILLALRMGINGVLLGTLISTMLTCFWIEPCVVFKIGFKRSTAPYFARYLFYTMVTALDMFVTVCVCSLIPYGGVGSFLLKLLCCLILPNGINMAVYWHTREMKYLISLMKGKMNHGKNREF